MLNVHNFTLTSTHMTGN